jgi:hypothetical protein
MACSEAHSFISFWSCCSNKSSAFAKLTQLTYMKLYIVAHLDFVESDDIVRNSTLQQYKVCL